MLSPSQVTAVIVTKGDVDLAPIVDSLLFDDICIWDNSCQAQPPEWWWDSDSRRPVTWCGSEDAMTYGRVLAAMHSRHGVVYSQDDDIVHSPDNQREILAAYQPGVLAGCMWPEWSQGAKDQGIEDGYDDLVFPGSGSVSDVSVWTAAVMNYLDRWPCDDFFRLWSDTIIGVIAPTRHLDIRFQALPCAEADDRMCNLPDAVALKTEAISRARAARDRKPSEHQIYMAELGTPHGEHRYL